MDPPFDDSTRDLGEQARTLRLDKARPQYEPRVSEADEQRFADEAHAKREAQLREQLDEQLADLERRIAHARLAVDQMADALPYVDRATRRDLGRVRRALGQIKGRYLGADYPLGTPLGHDGTAQP